jgi:hypothetical protein
MTRKIVTLDIECMANAVWSWQMYGKNWSAIEEIVEWSLLSMAAKWYGKKTQIYSLDQYKGYKPMMVRQGATISITQPDEKALLQDIWNILDEADVVIGWNSKRFDIKKINSKLIAYGFPPPSPYIQIDVMTEKKKLTASNSNKLENTGVEWKTGHKLPHQGFKLWTGCSEGDKKSWSLMRRYNIQDVVLTEKNYDYLKPWMQNHPVMNFNQDEARCTRCNSTDLWKKGIEFRGNGLSQRWKCKNQKCKANLYTGVKGKLPLKSA